MRSALYAILLLSAVVFGQFRDAGFPDPRTKLLAPSSSGSVFDMNNISMSHTFSMNYVSYGSDSYMNNEYVAGLKYRISDPLTLKLNLGMSYTPYSSFSIPGEDQTDIYLKSASLDYRPNEKFRMIIDFRNIRSGDMYFNSDPFKKYDFLNEDVER